MLIHYIPVYLRFMALSGNKKGGEEGGGGEKKYFHFIAQQNKNYLPADARQRVWPAAGAASLLLSRCKLPKPL